MAGREPGLRDGGKGGLGPRLGLSRCVKASSQTALWPPDSAGTSRWGPRKGHREAGDARSRCSDGAGGLVSELRQKLVRPADAHSEALLCPHLWVRRPGAVLGASHGLLHPATSQCSEVQPGPGDSGFYNVSVKTNM